ncbi:hypothetical protein D915_000746 [Fasciola hepatica]|uniref:Armadillo-like helical domain-containing protein n=1 Tax=Fasciola hepatica TaxID=6192 RepID=A0A4E0RLM7_FASHE|nr:hypothetical protein D915_000746 [Fasciola hepatica]
MTTNPDRRKNPKGYLKEKILQVYDKLFQVNVKCLTSHFEKSHKDDLALLKPSLNRLLMQCLHTAKVEKHRIRVANAIQTMDVLIAGVYRCKGASDADFIASDLLVTEQQAKEFMQEYTSLCSDMFREDRPERLRDLILNSVRTFATSSPMFWQNPFAVGLMDEKIFDLLRLTLVNAHLRYHHGMAACELLGLLIQFAQHESFQVDESLMERFCLTDDDLLLNGVSSTISLALSEFNLRFRQQHDPSVGFFSSVSSFFGSIFVGDMASNVSLRPCDSLLMCMYTITKDGAHFSTILSYSNAHCAADSRGFDTLSRTGSLRDEKLLRAFSTDSMIGFSVIQNHSTPGRAVPADDARDSDRQTISSMEGGTAALSTDRNRSLVSSARMSHGSSDLIDQTVLSVPLNGFSGDNVPTHEETDEVAMLTTLEPRNLLADLLEYCSIVMQDVKTPESLNSCHLCFIIVLCITQNPLACSILHDPHITFNVWIHQQRTRRRKSPPNACSSFSSRPIAIAILSLIVEFVRGHLMKRLPHRLYGLSLSICRNLLCYQIKHKIRLNFDWKQLWSALLNLLQFVRNLDDSYAPVIVGLGLIQKVLELFNLCILQGDAFLQSAGVYDDLYYELIRMHQLFQNLHEYALLHSTSADPELKAVALKVVLQMGNIRSIVNHFKAKIDAFSTANSLTSLTEMQVLEVVRENYDSLTLRVHEDLDVPETYLEEEDHILFETLVETVLKQMRKDCMETSLEMQSYLHELSAIY